MLESKKEIYDLIPQQYYPKTCLFTPQSSAEGVLQVIHENGIVFPFIAKPDIGQRGMQVKLVKDKSELTEYIAKSKVDFLIQEFVAFEQEIGIFYYRFPTKKTGKITGIVGKEFLKVTGDGNRTMEALIIQEPRFLLQLPVLRKTYGAQLKNVLKHGEEVVLVPYGNHSRGSKFLDLSAMADGPLQDMMNRVCSEIPEFYFGRMDIKFNTWEELREGRNFSIIELNGAGSEPTHIYDPKHSIFFAWKEIIKHLSLLQKISSINHKTKGTPYMTRAEGVKMLKENQKQVELISQ